MDITFCELRNKEVINVNCGKRLGKICDLVISCHTCKVTGIVLPNDRRLFRGKDDLYIPWCNILKIGADVILVRLEESVRGVHYEENCKGNSSYVISDDE